MTFEALPNYPMSLRWTCLVITGNTAFVTGGNGGSDINNVYELEIGSDQEWKAAPPMIQARATHTCGVFTTSGGDNTIMVVGGGPDPDSVEMFSENNREWRQGDTHK